MFAIFATVNELIQNSLVNNHVWRLCEGTEGWGRAVVFLKKKKKAKLLLTVK